MLAVGTDDEHAELSEQLRDLLALCRIVSTLGQIGSQIDDRVGGHLTTSAAHSTSTHSHSERTEKCAAAATTTAVHAMPRSSRSLSPRSIVSLRSVLPVRCCVCVALSHAVLLLLLLCAASADLLVDFGLECHILLAGGGDAHDGEKRGEEREEGEGGSDAPQRGR